jgi:membrane fusion protein (multidrug efflux system)
MATRRRLVWLGSALAVFFACLVMAGVWPRLARRTAMAAEERSAAETPARVAVLHAKRSIAADVLVLPGSVQPLQETGVYARANGYVRRWLFDIGAHVTKGQVMAELDVPDIDEELRQAQATAHQADAQTTQAKTQLALALITTQRYATLGAAGLATQQDVDQYRAAYEAQQANVAAAEAAHTSSLANVERLRDLKSFALILAPFAGVVTARTAEVGQLVVAGTGKALFTVAEVDTVRVFVHVPQLYAGDVTVGLDAPVTVRELPSRAFPGKVARTAHALDTATRTLLTEVDVPNADDALIAGMYGQVSFRMTGHGEPLSVPATAVLIDARGTRVAMVRDDVVTWKSVEIARDFGDRLAIGTGVTGEDVLVAAPSDRLVEGMRVSVR